MKEEIREAVDKVIDELVDGRVEPLDEETEKAIDTINESYGEE